MSFVDEPLPDTMDVGLRVRLCTTTDHVLVTILFVETLSTTMSTTLVLPVLVRSFIINFCTVHMSVTTFIPFSLLFFVSVTLFAGTAVPVLHIELFFRLPTSSTSPCIIIEHFWFIGLSVICNLL
jgi:hypothetical protein